MTVHATEPVDAGHERERLEAWLTPDPWLAARLGVPAYRLDADRAERIGAAASACPGPAFVYTRIGVEEAELVAAAQEAGFRLADTTVTLERPRLPGYPGRPLATVRATVPADEEPVTALARRAFGCSRFHADPVIDDAVADAIKADWAGGYYAGRRGDAMVVAETGRGDTRAIAGFLLAIARRDGTLVIDLVAVDGACRGRGLAAAMTAHAQTLLPETTRLRVGTQLANAAALRLYRGLGFEIATIGHTFHLHLQPRPHAKGRA